MINFVNSAHNSLPLWVVRILYTGPDASGVPVRVGPPSEAEVISTLTNSFISKVYPVSGIDYAGTTIAEFNGILTLQGSSGCGQGWNDLLGLLQTIRSGTTQRPDAVFLGLLPTGVPTGSVVGCGGGHVAAGRILSGVVLAQEIGHAYGRLHAPACNAPNPDPNYPSFTSLPAGSIHEFGFDTTTSSVFSPTTTFDFMSYCGSPWTSPYTYLNLFFALQFPGPFASSSPVGEASTDPPREYLHLNFRMHRDGTVDLLRSFRLSLPVEPVATRPSDSVIVELRGEGETIGFHRAHIFDPHADIDASYRDFYEVIPWQPQTTHIAFLRAGEEVASIEVSGRAPAIVGLTINEEEERQRRSLRIAGK